MVNLVVTIANLAENKQNSNKGYRKTKKCLKELQTEYICDHRSSLYICNIVIGFFFACRQAFLDRVHKKIYHKWISAFHVVNEIA